ncbi:MAG TPA: hypothetical protein VF212_14540 [Longimicrobiales bacterium]
MSIWGILLVFAGVVLAVNVLVVAVCTVAARSDVAMDRLTDQLLGEQGTEDGEAAGREEGSERVRRSVAHSPRNGV